MKPTAQYTHRPHTRDHVKEDGTGRNIYVIIVLTHYRNTIQTILNAEYFYGIFDFIPKQICIEIICTNSALSYNRERAASSISCTSPEVVKRLEFISCVHKRGRGYKPVRSWDIQCF